MDAPTLRVVGVGLLLVLILMSGILLMRSEKPHNRVLLNVHKLAALAAGVLLVVIVTGAHQASPLGPAELAAIAFTVVLFVGTAATGGLLAIDKEMPAVVQRLHQVVPVLTVLSTAGTLVLVLGGA
jgi:hypothetical protein